jgi:signal transduction histidine kinase/CheY-like chemotaxis protein
VIATATRVASTDWLVVAVVPRAEALAPALATLGRTLLLVAVGGALALLASVLFARRMAAPIVALRQATRRIAAGDLATPIRLSSGDEIEQLADDFNTMARELQASYAGLEAKVADRTAALSDARDRLQAQAAEVAALNERLVAQMAELAQRQQQAERASVAKTRFLAAASHDLRQPMHSIGLLVSLLRHQLSNQVEQSLADKVQQSVTVMEGLFSSLLDISKLDAGAVLAEPRPLAIGALLAQVGDTYAPQAAARGLRLRVVRSRLMVRSDPVLLARMLGNLVANAVRYTQRGGIVIGCRRRGDQVAVQVIDSGPGIAAAQQALVFEEFVRLPQGATVASEGLGLGLSIVQRSAAVLGHGLQLRSTPGRGSCFELLLPIEVATPLPTSRLAPADRARLAGAFVLVVDDNDGNREATAALCRHWGCLTLAASGLAAAMAGLDAHLRAPDLLITDQRLGDGPGGFEVIEAVRAQTGEQTPAIIVTADIDSGQAGRAGAMQAWLLHKPAGGESLLRAAVQALGGSA